MLDRQIGSIPNPFDLIPKGVRPYLFPLGATSIFALAACTGGASSEAKTSPTSPEPSATPIATVIPDAGGAEKSPIEPCPPGAFAESRTFYVVKQGGVSLKTAPREAAPEAEKIDRGREVKSVCVVNGVDISNNTVGWRKMEDSGWTYPQGNLSDTPPAVQPPAEATKTLEVQKIPLKTQGVYVDQGVDRYLIAYVLPSGKVGVVMNRKNITCTEGITNEILRYGNGQLFDDASKFSIGLQGGHTMGGSISGENTDQLVGDISQRTFAMVYQDKNITCNVPHTPYKAIFAGVGTRVLESAYSELFRNTSEFRAPANLLADLQSRFQGLLE